MSYAGAIANVVGGELQGWASVLEKQAMKGAYNEEDAKQDAFKRQAQDTFNQGLTKSGADAAKTDMSNAAASRTGQYQLANNTPLSLTSSPTTQGYSSPITNMFAQQYAAPRANLMAYGDWQHQLGVQNEDEQRVMNQIINFAGGEARNVFPYQMYAAQHSLDDLSMAGQAISSIGGAAANYAQLAQAPRVSNQRGFGNMDQSYVNQTGSDWENMGATVG